MKLTPLSFIKIPFALWLLYLGYVMFATHEPLWFIQNVNLIMHEAGHAFMMFFGHFLHIFGGTLFEFGVPLMFATYFFLNRQLFATGFALWWASTAFLSIARYAGDAQAQVLPLLGGDNVGHDWFNMLSMLGALPYTELISTFIYGIGVFALIVAGVVWYADITKTHLYGIPSHNASYTRYR